MGVIEASYPKTDAEWQAREDARVLATANVIKNDPNRLSKAQTEAAKMAEHDRKEAVEMSKVAGQKKPSGASGSGGKRTVGTGAGSPMKNHNVFQKI